MDKLTLISTVFTPLVGSAAIYCLEVLRQWKEFESYQKKMSRLFLQERINRMDRR